MVTRIFELSTEDPDGIDAAVTKWVERVLLDAPFQMQENPDRCFLALPTIVQRMMLRNWKRDLGSTKIGSFLNADHRVVFSKLFGYSVVPGYEMAVVLYYGDGPIDPEQYVYRVPFGIEDNKLLTDGK